MTVKHIVVISLGEVSTPNMSLTVAAFKDILNKLFKVPAEEIEKKWDPLFKGPLVQLIGQFRLGWIPKEESMIDPKNLDQDVKEALTEKRFRLKFCKLLSDTFGKPIAIPEVIFNQAWCVMSQVTPENFAHWQDLMNDPTIDVYLHSGTNSLQFKHILAQLRRYKSEFTIPQDHLTLSFREGKQNHDLLAVVNDKITKQCDASTPRIYIFGDAKFVENLSFRLVAEKRTEEMSAAARESGFCYIRKKGEDPNSYTYVKACCADVDDRELVNTIRERARLV